MDYRFHPADEKASKLNGEAFSERDPRRCSNRIMHEISDLKAQAELLLKKAEHLESQLISQISLDSSNLDNSADVHTASIVNSGHMEVPTIDDNINASSTSLMGRKLRTNCTMHVTTESEHHTRTQHMKNPTCAFCDRISACRIPDVQNLTNGGVPKVRTCTLCDRTSGCRIPDGLVDGAFRDKYNVGVPMGVPLVTSYPLFPKMHSPAATSSETTTYKVILPWDRTEQMNDFVDGNIPMGVPADIFFAMFPKMHRPAATSPLTK